MTDLNPVDAMTTLSPAAQAVSNAAKSSLDWEAGYLPNIVAAAALRAACANIGDSYNCSSSEALDLIIAIAAELEANAQ